MEFFLSKDYKELINLGGKLSALMDDGAVVKRGDKTQTVESFEQSPWMANGRGKNAAKPFNVIKVLER
jgi:hypothetical protein